MTTIDTLEMAGVVGIEAYGRIEALLQSVLGKVDNLGQEVARQGERLVVPQVRGFILIY